MTRTPTRLAVARIIHAAEAVLAEGGREMLTAAAIAVEAEVSPQTIYNRFGTMEALLDDLAATGHRLLTARLLDQEIEPLASIGDPLTMLIELLRRHRSFAMARPRLHQFLFDEQQPWRSGRTERAAAEPFDLLVAVVRRGIDAGLLLPGQPAEIATRLWAAAQGALRAELVWPGPAGTDWPGSYEATVATMIRGLRPSAQLR